ncbi:sigma-70 family RNA polymerase sigma factor [Planobispora takensis]|uniref:sigma-70 family RNA polymerase sigma factor n=1 Tax=Planobispora takensis TaxID=1367882 RepID=UPI0019455754|nr:sigma-70 family RNA polymerase sigma factor [Planobispora takensis]
MGTALLLTGSHDQAIRLVLRAFRTVGQAWPPTAWENPTQHAYVTLYHAFLRRPAAAGPTALVRLPARRRLVVVACLHNGRTPAEMADILDLPVETVEAEVTEALTTLTKGDRQRLTNRFATQAGEASVPDLSERSFKTLRRRGRRRALLTALAVLAMAGFIVTLTPQGQTWTSALALGEKAPQSQATTSPAAAGTTVDSTGSTDPSASPAASASPEPSGSSTASPETPVSAETSPAPWRAPRTSSVIRYAVPGECGARPGTPWAGKVLCAGWTLKLAAGGERGQASGGPGETTLNVPDAVQSLEYGDGAHRTLSPVISRDGHRVAYLSAADLRYVAHDLTTGTRRYLSPALTPADVERGPSVSVSGDGRRFTVDLATGRLRTDFATGSASRPAPGDRTPAEEAADWLRTRYPAWKDSPSGRYAAAVAQGDTGGEGVLHIVDATARRVFKRLPLPSSGSGVTGEVVGWLNTREVVIALTGGDTAGLYRIHAVSGQYRRLPDLPAADRIALGALTAR